MSWLTNNTVPADERTSRILPKHFFWNAASPTANTSSKIRISGRRWMATAKPRRTYMPLLYRFTGVSRNLPISENSTISSEFLFHFGLAHAEDAAGEEHVLAAGEFGMESRPDF